MRALVATGHGGPEVLALRDDHPEPVPGPHDLLVAVRACGLNPVDVKVREGRYGAREQPYVLGYDVCGVVRAVGSAVGDFAPGDSVYVSPGRLRDGGYAELVCVDARLAAHKPARLDHVAAAALPLVVLTAWEALLDRARIHAGETVLVHAGAGGVGHVALQLARHRRARVLTTASRPETQALCRELGAHVVIDHRSEDFVARVLEETGGRGAEVVFDTVGGETFDRSLECVALNGRMVTIVANESRVISQRLFQRNATLIYEYMGVPGIHGVGFERQAEILRLAAGLADAGALRPHVSRVVALEEVPSALAEIAAGRAIGKFVARIAEAD